MPQNEKLNEKKNINLISDNCIYMTAKRIMRNIKFYAPVINVEAKNKN